jgi:hypothetical protein
MFRSAIAIAALVASVVAIAQALPLYGVAQYGSARFAASESSADVSEGSTTGGTVDSSGFGVDLGGFTNGTAEEDASAQTVPSMPLWATITLACLLWTMVYLTRKKGSRQ